MEKRSLLRLIPHRAYYWAQTVTSSRLCEIFAKFSRGCKFDDAYNQRCVTPYIKRVKGPFSQLDLLRIDSKVEFVPS